MKSARPFIGLDGSRGGSIDPEECDWFAPLEEIQTCPPPGLSTEARYVFDSAGCHEAPLFLQFGGRFFLCTGSYGQGAGGRFTPVGDLCRNLVEIDRQTAVRILHVVGAELPPPLDAVDLTPGAKVDGRSFPATVYQAGVSWPPCWPFYVNRLRERLHSLVEQAELLRAPSFDDSIHAARVWDAVRAVEEVLAVKKRGVIRGEWRLPFPEVDLWDAERRLTRLIEQLPWVGERLAHRPSSTPIGSVEFTDTLKAILKLIPDPLDGPQGNSLVYFSWAEYHMGVEPRDFYFDAKFDQGFKAAWADAAEPFGGELPHPGVVVQRRWRLLIERGIVREPPRRPQELPSPPEEWPNGSKKRGRREEMTLSLATEIRMRWERAKESKVSRSDFLDDPEFTHFEHKGKPVVVTSAILQQALHRSKPSRVERDGQGR